LVQLRCAAIKSGDETLERSAVAGRGDEGRDGRVAQRIGFMQPPIGREIRSRPPQKRILEERDRRRERDLLGRIDRLAKAEHVADHLGQSLVIGQLARQRGLVRVGREGECEPHGIVTCKPAHEAVATGDSNEHAPIRFVEDLDRPVEVPAPIVDPNVLTERTAGA
jgi:hypothetical protein